MLLCRIVIFVIFVTGTKQFTWNYGVRTDFRECGMCALARWKLESPEVQTFWASSISGCLSACLKETNCSCLNYVRSTHSCELIEELECQKAVLLLAEDTSAVFYSRSVCQYQDQYKCKSTVRGLDYIGHLATTPSGRTCQNWTSQLPHFHYQTDPAGYPDPSIEAARNFCRNQDHNDFGPWCYTMDPGVRWEYCDVRLCSCTDP